MTAGQGFGSATGQYMDVCLKFDTRTLTGYGLRIIRTTKHAKAVDFYLVEYRQGIVKQLTEAVSATCYRTGCLVEKMRGRHGYLHIMHKHTPDIQEHFRLIGGVFLSGIEELFKSWSARKKPRQPA